MLRDFQKIGIEFAMRNKRVLIADDMGLGKTVQSIEASRRSSPTGPIVVVCPPSLKYNWQREIKKWSGENSTIVENDLDFEENEWEWMIIPYSKLAQCVQRHTTTTVKWNRNETEYRRIKHHSCIVKPGSLLDGLMRDDFTHIIVDESHYIKNKKALRSYALGKLCENRTHRFFLSGTPVLNKPIDLAFQLECLGVLGPLFNGWYGFVARHCGMQRLSFGGRRILKTDGASHLNELNEKLLENCMIRRKKEDVLKELPPLTSSSIELDLSNIKEYTKAHTNFLDWLWHSSYEEFQNLPEEEIYKDLSKEEIEMINTEYANNRVRRARSAMAMVKINHLKQLSAKGKLKAFKDWAEDVMSQDQKVIVFAHHLHIQEKIEGMFKDCARLSGKDSVLVRQNNIDRFQEDPSCKTIVCSMSIGGLGHNITAASIVAIFEFPWTTAEVNQAIARAHRMGQKRSVNAYYFVGRNTIDIDILKLLAGKEDAIDIILDGKKGNVFNSLLTSLGDHSVEHNPLRNSRRNTSVSASVAE